MPSKQDTKAIAAWMKEKTDLVQFRARKHEHLPERVQQAVDAGFGKSRQAYMIDAIKAALLSDGIPEWNADAEECAQAERGSEPEKKQSLMEQLRAEMENMSASRKQEVLNFARFLRGQDQTGEK